MKRNGQKLRFLIVLCLVLCALLLLCGCGDDGTTSTTSSTSATIPPKEYTYYEASFYESDTAVVSTYSGEQSAPAGYEDIFYSTNEPGGEPKTDGEVSIWVRITPVGVSNVLDLDIQGEYDSWKAIGGDIYKISGVKSDLKIDIVTNYLYYTTTELFGSFGYGITDDGYATLKWNQDDEAPIRYVEVRYNDGTAKTEYIDASLGEATLFKMTENKKYTVRVSAVGYKNVGKEIKFDLCYMTEPKEISFPRVEITTENLVWPTFDIVNSPNKYWGQGIKNAEYEQCAVTVYNESDEVVFSSADMDGGVEYGGAKMKVRGNTSASKVTDTKKYPYKIKLNKKADLLEHLIDRDGEKSGYADKNWLLLSYGEEGFRIGGEAVADAVGTQWTPDYCYVSLYVNGDYRGLYVLSEAVNDGNGEGDEQWRVPVSNDGFLFECDAYWWNEDLYFTTPMTENTAMFYTFKYPDSDDITAESPEYAYIRNYMISFEEALKKNDDSYLEYIDLESFAKWLLVSDYLCISDGGGANIYLYKYDSTDASKVCLGPNWDFDSWMGDVRSLASIRIDWSASPFYFPDIVKKDSFDEEYSRLFEETKNLIIYSVNEAFSKIDMEAHDGLLEYETVRYGKQYKSLSEIQSEFVDWLEEHISWMDTKIN